MPLAANQPPTLPRINVELLMPVRYAGQVALKSQADYVVSTHQHYVGLLCHQVESFKSLPDGWDGYDGVAPSETVVDNTLRLMPLLPSVWALRLKQEDITPTPYGTITLEWQPGCEQYFGIEIGERNWAAFGKLDGRIVSDNVDGAYHKHMLSSIGIYLQMLYPEVSSQTPAFSAYPC
jgi:hypothetical protein